MSTEDAVAEALHEFVPEEGSAAELQPFVKEPIAAGSKDFTIRPDEDDAVEIFPFAKGDISPVGKDFTIRSEPVDIVEVVEVLEVEDDPKDSSAVGSALSSGSISLEPEEPPAPAEKALDRPTSVASKPTSSTPPTTSAGKATPPVAVPTPNSGSPSVEK